MRRSLLIALFAFPVSCFSTVLDVFQKQMVINDYKSSSFIIYHNPSSSPNRILYDSSATGNWTSLCLTGARMQLCNPGTLGEALSGEFEFIGKIDLKGDSNNTLYTISTTLSCVIGQPCSWSSPGSGFFNRPAGQNDIYSYTIRLKNVVFPAAPDAVDGAVDFYVSSAEFPVRYDKPVRAESDVSITYRAQQLQSMFKIDIKPSVSIDVTKDNAVTESKIGSISVFAYNSGVSIKYENQGELSDNELSVLLAGNAMQPNVSMGLPVKDSDITIAIKNISNRPSGKYSNTLRFVVAYP